MPLFDQQLTEIQHSAFSDALHEACQQDRGSAKENTYRCTKLLSEQAFARLPTMQSLFKTLALKGWQ